MACYCNFSLGQREHMHIPSLCDLIPRSSNVKERVQHQLGLRHETEWGLVSAAVNNAWRSDLDGRCTAKCKTLHIRIHPAHEHYYHFSPVSLESSPSAIMAGMHSFGSVLAIKH